MLIPKKINKMKQPQQMVTKHYEITDYETPTELSQGLAETHEQVNDTYSSGNNDFTFIRDGEDKVKKK